MKKIINGKEYELINTPDFDCSCYHCAFGFGTTLGGCKTDDVECLVEAEITPKHWKEVTNEQKKHKAI